MAEVKKQEKDYTKEVDALLSEARSLAEKVRTDSKDPLYEQNLISVFRLVNYRMHWTNSLR